jgi:tagatose 1,6-diphosphate aldolase
MKQLSIGKFRGLQQCSSRLGTFTCLALDHRQNLRKALNPENPSVVTDKMLSRFKMSVVASLADLATAVLLDPEVSAAQAIATQVLPGHVGLVVAVEATGYAGEPHARLARILPGWSVEKARRMGASMIKLLVYYHPLSPTAGEIEAFIAQVAEESLKHDIALMLEPLSYPLTGSKLSDSEKRYVVVETARRLTTIPGVDILKAEFPLTPENRDFNQWVVASQEITAASSVPWILLSAAVDFETYLQQVVIACQSGASGIAVGRAVWQEAVTMDDAARNEFLRSTARARLERLEALCRALARPWSEYYSAAAPFDWYKTY